MDGTLQEAQGITRDISDRGIFIVAKELPPIGKHVELDVHLPQVTGKLHGEGIVVWTSRRDAEVKGFGASVIFRTESSDIPTALGPERIQ
jgi:Tfp pilus assembly protein PilZ